MVEYISPAPAVISSPEPVVEYLAPAPVVIQSTTPVVEYLAPVPAMFQAPTPVVEYLAPAPVVSPALVEEFFSPVMVVDAVPALVMECIAPSVHTQIFFLSVSLSPTSPDTETHFPIVNGTKNRRGIETPTGSSRFRPVDEAGHVLDVQVERVVRACVALGVRMETHEKERETVGGDFASSRS